MRGVAAVLLAAGGSRRMGRSKQLLAPEGGRSLVRRAAECALASRCARAFAVLGAEAEAVAAELAGLDLELVRNPRWREGLASSVRAGTAAARPAAEAVLFLPVDQPRVTAATLDRLVEAWDGTPGGVAACAIPGGLGAPALFGRAHFDALLALEGDRGARPLLERHRERVVAVPCPEAALDVDTPDDLRRLRERRAPPSG